MPQALPGPLSHPIPADAPGNIGNAIRKWVAKQQCQGLPLHPRGWHVCAFPALKQNFLLMETPVPRGCIDRCLNSHQLDYKWNSCQLVGITRFPRGIMEAHIGWTHWGFAAVVSAPARFLPRTSRAEPLRDAPGNPPHSRGCSPLGPAPKPVGSPGSRSQMALPEKSKC